MSLLILIAVLLLIIPVFLITLGNFRQRDPESYWISFAYFAALILILILHERGCDFTLALR